MPTTAELAAQSGASPFFANLADTAMGAINPYITGPLGQSPQTLAAIDAFQAQTLPVIQQQLQLQGLGQSPAVAQLAAGALGAQLPQLYQQENQNRLAALGLIPQLQAGQQAEQQLGLARSAQEFAQGPQFDFYKHATEGAASREAAGLAADIANRQAQLQLQGYGQAGDFLLGLGQLNNQAAQLQMGQQQALAQGLLGAGDIQQQQQQDLSDAVYQDYLRRQAITESATFGAGQNAFFPTTAFSDTNSSKF